MATWVKQSGRPVSCAITPSGGSLQTVTDILDAKIIRDDDLIEHYSGNKQTALILQGNHKRGIEIKTTDVSVLATCPKGTHCTAVVLTLEGVKLGSTGALANTDADVTATLTDCTQMADLGLGAQPGGNPGEITLQFMVCQDPADGSEGTLVVAVA
jgi:hypothetical protein